MKAWIAALALLMAAQGAAATSFYGGNRLMAECEKTGQGESLANATRYSTCVSYLAGVVDTTDAWHESGRLQGRLCLPKGVSMEQLRQVFLQWMRQNPAEWHYSASSSVMGAFSAAWPCKK
jgi:hypothetical protein